MTVFKRTVTATLITATNVQTALRVLDGSVSMDEGTSPFTRGSIRVARPPQSVLDQMDPALKPRLRLFIQTTGTPGRTWNLYITARQANPDSGDVALNIESLEAYLFDYAPTERVDLRGYQSSLTQVRQVLQRALGSTPVMSAAAANVSLPTLSAKKNLVPIPSMETDWSGAGYTPSGVSVARVTTWRQSGTYSLQMTPNTSNPDSYADIAMNLSAGQTYTASGYIRQGALPSGTQVSMNRARGISIITADGSTRVLATSNQALLAANYVTRVSVTFTVPANATANFLRLYHGHPSGSAPVFWDAIMVTEGNGQDTNGQALTYFDGSTTQTGYSMAWDGQAHLSTSSRTPLVERPEELYIWDAGVTAWNYLQPILQATGTRLFNPGFGLWELSGTDWLTSTTVVRVAAGVNLYSYSDLLSRTATRADGLPLFADAVIVNYTWLDPQGVEQKRSDVAAPTGYTKPYVIDRQDQTFPGPGTAAYVLQRIQARRKQVSVTGAADISVLPSQLVSITSPTGEVLTGIVHAVTHDLVSGVMTLTTKGLVSLPANSIGRAPAGQTIGSVAGTIADYRS